VVEVEYEIEEGGIKKIRINEIYLYFCRRKKIKYHV